MFMKRHIHHGPGLQLVGVLWRHGAHGVATEDVLLMTGLLVLGRTVTGGLHTGLHGQSMTRLTPLLVGPRISRRTLNHGSIQGDLSLVNVLWKFLESFIIISDVVLVLHFCPINWIRCDIFLFDLMV